jgi:spermidine/putrescine transport system ATP-binding protein
VFGRGIVKRFGRTQVFDGLDFDIPERSFTTLLGPSGCGKTTILRLLAGFEEPDGGTLTLDGRSILGVPPERRPVNTVFQSYALFPHMTVAANVAFPLSVVERTRAAAARVKATLELVHMAEFADKYPAQLSGGQQQRVALARAVIADPLMLLLDEPLSALDRRMRSYLQGELKRLQRRLDRAFVFVTHDQEEAFALSDLIYVMNAGRILQRGTPEEIYARPADSFVAGFIGDAALLPGRIAKTGEGRATIDTPLGAQTAPAHETLEAGDRAVLVLRPEAVALASAASAAVRGTVTDTTFTGTGYRITVDCAGHRLLATAARALEPGRETGLAPHASAGFITPEAAP